MPRAPAEGMPQWRGVIHQYAVAGALVAGPLLVAHASTPRAQLGGAIFCASLVLLFTVSACYHRVAWGPRMSAWMRRADHSCIFVLIAGTYTPFAMLRMTPDLGENLLWISWGGALVGVLPSLFWKKAPHALIAIICVSLGWAGVPYWTDPRNDLDFTLRALILAGGFFYTIGAVFYATKKPQLSPLVFSYHEMFHVCTIFAAVFHYAAVWIAVS